MEDADNDKDQPGENEKLTAIYSFVDKNGDQRVSYEYSDQSNCQHDKTKSPTENDQDVPDDDENPKPVSGPAGSSIRRIKIVRK